MRFKSILALARASAVPLAPVFVLLFVSGLFMVPISISNILTSIALLAVCYFLAVGALYANFLLKNRGLRPNGWETMSDDERSKLIINAAMGFDRSA